jgi:hypothetical protein
VPGRFCGVDVAAGMAGREASDVWWTVKMVWCSIQMERHRESHQIH